ncbi:KTSC domain-containing protein [Clostridium lacusfryxellense]|uniref:KTSC domain-containing protein n=1 Tax=Clostridium lacusfryxellense TaxID=205328 RepID=UPI001C0B2B73|nr:KTSC domain-containing protein [Clostridium lacusfryxellense]MBU3111980.1 KTSC domain-containing protein [Clostridium lacusfryxellense]
MLKVKMVSVKSSNVKSVGYDEDYRSIHVELISGEKYMYKCVPKMVFEDLLIATSIGSYINRYLRDSYDVETQNSFYALEKASKPLIDYLNKYYNPMATAIVTEGRVDIVSNEMGMPLKVRD